MPPSHRPSLWRASRIAAAIALAAACEGGAGDRTRPEDRALVRGRRMLAEAARCANGTGDGRAVACRAACDLGHSNSCHGAGALRDAAGDAAGALALYDLACAGGSGLGCEAAGRARRAGLGGPPDRAAAERLDRQARFHLRAHCEQRHAPSCLALGRLYATARGGLASTAASAAFLARACALGLHEACVESDMAPSPTSAP